MIYSNNGHDLVIWVKKNKIGIYGKQNKGKNECWCCQLCQSHWNTFGVSLSQKLLDLIMP